MGPGDSKLLCGSTTIIEEKERCDRKGRGEGFIERQNELSLLSFD